MRYENPERPRLTDREYVATTKNGMRVGFDPETSHAATHLREISNLRELVVEMITRIEIDGDGDYFFEQDMGREVGVTDRVETTAEDEVFYAMRPHRKTYTRFVRNRKAEPTNYVTIVLRKIDNEYDYDLWSAWTGRTAPQFPGDAHAAPESIEFWNHHALIDGSMEIVPGTERSDCPWAPTA